MIDLFSGLGRALSSQKWPLTALDILLVSSLIYWGIILIKETRAARMLYGLLVLGLLFLLGRWLDLELLNWLLKYLVTTLLVAIPIVFQPELRAGLERLGRSSFVGRFGTLVHPRALQVIDDIVAVSETLAKNHTGALIAVERDDSLEEYAETGTEMQAKLTPQLILTIFHPHTPLHDGGATLPVFPGPLEYNLGTRHKAALALAQQTDAIVIAISEEKGTISAAYDHKIRFGLSADELKRALLRLLKQSK